MQGTQKMKVDPSTEVEQANLSNHSNAAMVKAMVVSVREKAKLAHIPHIHAGFFRDGHRQCFACRIHSSHCLMGLDGSFGEHIRLPSCGNGLFHHQHTFQMALSENFFSSTCQRHNVSTYSPIQDL